MIGEAEGMGSEYHRGGRAEVVRKQIGVTPELDQVIKR